MERQRSPVDNVLVIVLLTFAAGIVIGIVAIIFRLSVGALTGLATILTLAWAAVPIILAVGVALFLHGRGQRSGVPKYLQQNYNGGGVDALTQYGIAQSQQPALPAPMAQLHLPPDAESVFHFDYEGVSKHDN